MRDGSAASVSSAFDRRAAVRAQNNRLTDRMARALGQGRCRPLGYRTSRPGRAGQEDGLAGSQERTAAVLAKMLPPGNMPLRRLTMSRPAREEGISVGTTSPGLRDTRPASPRRGSGAAGKPPSGLRTCRRYATGAVVKPDAHLATNRLGLAQPGTTGHRAQRLRGCGRPPWAERDRGPTSDPALQAARKRMQATTTFTNTGT